MARILVVDDEKCIRNTLREFLCDAGFEVHTAADADEAMAFLRQTNYDLVVADIFLPQQSGFDLLRLTREYSPSVQFIIMTGNPSVDSASEAMRLGAVDYLYKPIVKEAILRSARHALKIKELNDQKIALEEANRRYREDLEKLVEERTHALRESKRQLKTIWETVDTGIVIVDIETNRIVDSNPAVRHLLGADAESFEGRDCREILCGDECNLCVRQIHGQELEIQTSTGTIRHLLKMSSPVILRKRQHAVVALVDITERKRAEQEKALLEGQLLQAQKMEAIGQLAGGIAHDFNNLLTVIIGGHEFARESLPAESEAHEYLEEAQEAAVHASDLTRKLLAFSRRQELQRQVLDLDYILTGLLKILRRLVGEDIKLSYVTETGSSYTVEADPGQIEHVIVNLVVNARDAMPDGGKLILSLGNVKVGENDWRYTDINGRIPFGDYVRLDISDTGSGMAESIRRRIFEPFFTTKASGKGTGLGLSTAYGIVYQHDGFMSVDSEVGIGSCFSIFLPLVGNLDTGSADDTALNDLPRGNETVLVVEDDTAVRRIEVRILAGLGYQVLEASSAKDAMRVAEESPVPVDLLLTDVIMPGMDGVQLASVVEKQYPHIKVVFVSGYTDDRLARIGIGIDGIAKNLVIKPVAKRQLAQAVRNALDIKE